jgi:hypothetical protein
MSDSQAISIRPLRPQASTAELFDFPDSTRQLIECLVAIVNQDNYVTIEEFVWLSLVVDNLCQHVKKENEQSNNLLLSTYLLKTLTEPGPTLDVALSRFKQTLHAERLQGAASQRSDNVVESIHESFRLCAIPLIATQPNENELQVKWDRCFEATTSSSEKSFLRRSLEPSRKLMKGLFSQPQVAAESDFKRELKFHGEMWKNKPLLQSLELNDLTKIKNGLQLQLDLMRRVSDKIFPNEAGFREIKLLCSNFQKVVDAYFGQFQKRFEILTKRLELQQSTFERDWSEFRESALQKIRLKMVDATFGQGNDYMAQDKWAHFASSETYEIVKLKYGELKARTETLNNIWDQELRSFSDELDGFTKQVTSSIFELYDRLDRAQISKLIQNKQLSEDIRTRLNVLANFVSKTSDLVIVAGAASLAANSFSLASVAVILATPVGLASVVVGAGIIAGAKIWQFFSNAEVQKLNSIQSKMSFAEAKFDELFPCPVVQHREALTRIGDRFVELAEEYHRPIFNNVQLLLLRQDFLRQVALKVRENTERKYTEYLNELTAEAKEIRK